MVGDCSGCGFSPGIFGHFLACGYDFVFFAIRRLEEDEFIGGVPVRREKLFARAKS